MVVISVDIVSDDLFAYFVVITVNIFFICIFVDVIYLIYCFFFSSRRRHTRYWRDWSSDVCSSDLRMRRSRRSRTKGSRERAVPLSLARCGMTLKASPAWKVVTDTTALCSGSTLRATDRKSVV